MSDQASTPTTETHVFETTITWDQLTGAVNVSAVHPGKIQMLGLLELVKQACFDTWDKQSAPRLIPAKGSLPLSGRDF